MCFCLQCWLPMYKLQTVRPCVHHRQNVIRHFCRYIVVNGFKWECVHRQRHDKNVSELLMRLVKCYNSSLTFPSYDCYVARVFQRDCADLRLVCHWAQCCACTITWPHLVGANAERVCSLIPNAQHTFCRIFVPQGASGMLLHQQVSWREIEGPTRVKSWSKLETLIL
jgi:hypothetical protein